MCLLSYLGSSSWYVGNMSRLKTEQLLREKVGISWYETISPLKSLTCEEHVRINWNSCPVAAWFYALLPDDGKSEKDVSINLMRLLTANGLSFLQGKEGSFVVRDSSQKGVYTVSLFSRALEWVQRKPFFLPKPTPSPPPPAPQQKKLWPHPLHPQCSWNSHM